MKKSEDSKIEKKKKDLLNQHREEFNLISKAYEKELGQVKVNKDEATNDLVINVDFWKGSQPDLNLLPKEIGGVPVKSSFSEPTVEEVIKQCDSVETVNKVFDTLASAYSPDSTAYKALIDGLESSICSDLSKAKTELRDLFIYVAAVQKEPTGAAEKLLNLALSMDEELSEIGQGLQVIAHLAFRLYALKGDTANPMIKAYAQELSKLSDEEYNSSISQVGVLGRVVNQRSTTAAAPKNPFRP